MSKIPIRIVVIITGLEANGAELMLLRLLEKLDRNRFSVCVISLTTIGDVGPQIRSLGFSVEAMGFRPTFGAVRTFIRLVRRLSTISPNILHTWMYHGDLIGGIAGKIVGIRHIVWSIRHTDLSLNRNKKSTLVVAKTCALLSGWLPDIVTVNSTAARLAHIRYGYSSKKMLVLPNGINVDQFQPSKNARIYLRDELNVNQETLLVGVVGRYHLQKNQIGFVQAMSIILAVRPEVHFVFIGAEMNSNNIKFCNLIKEAGVANVCHLLGARDDMPRLIAALDLLALPSLGEAFPNVVAEAMSCEVPCVVTDVGDASYIIGESGRVVPNGAMDSLGYAICDLLSLPSDERARLGKMARMRVEKHFKMSQVVNQYESFYTNLFANVSKASF